jgi:hypothetical protein
MASIIKDEWPALGAKIQSVLIYDGLPVTAGEVVKQILDGQGTAGVRRTAREAVGRIQLQG